MEIQIDEDGTPFVMWGESRIQLETKPITDPAVLDKAREELRETPDTVKQALQELRGLLKGEPIVIKKPARIDFRSTNSKLLSIGSAGSTKLARDLSSNYSSWFIGDS